MPKHLNKLKQEAEGTNIKILENESSRRVQGVREFKGSVQGVRVLDISINGTKWR
jgi:hypothetical protein